MTINKILFSTLAAAALTTSAFADACDYTASGSGAIGECLVGNLAYLGDEAIGDNSVVIATEIANSSAMNLDANNIDPDADATISYLTFVPSLNGSATVSDPTIIYTFPGDFSAGSANDLTAQIGTMDVEDLNDAAFASVAVLESIVYSAVTGQSTFTFKDDSTHTILNSHTYAITDGTNAGVVTPLITIAITPSIATDKIRAELWSTSGTEQLRSAAEASPFALKDQFKVTCVSKFDGMINFENAALTFVPTQHGLTQNALLGGFGIIALFDQDRDAFNFEVQSDIDNDINYKLDGLNSRLDILGNTNPINAIPAAVGALTDAAAPVGDLTITAANELRYTFTAAIPQGTTVYTAYAVADLANDIQENVWTGNAYMNGDVRPALGGLPAIALPAIDENPAIDYAANGNAGEWKNFVYIAQIPAVSYNPGNTKVNVYMTNRSCTAATPEFKLIRNGEVSVVDGAEIAVNSQGKTNINAIVDAARLDPRNAGNADLLSASLAPFALEVTLAGNAEDFYVAAQMINLTNGANKDLPVYNTSTRD